MKCSAGDKARIIMSLRQENLGRVVNVESLIGYYEKGTSFSFRGIECIAPVSDHYWWISSDNLSNLYGDTPKAYIADSWLEPLKDPLHSIEDHSDLELVS